MIGGLNGEQRSVLQLPGADDVVWDGHAERPAVSTDTDAETSAKAGAFRRSNHASKLVRGCVACGTESVLIVAKRRVGLAGDVWGFGAELPKWNKVSLARGWVARWQANTRGSTVHSLTLDLSQLPRRAARVRPLAARCEGCLKGGYYRNTSTIVTLSGR
jgi:ribosomal protein S14